MQRTRTSRYATIVATFGLALGIGFVMQNGDAVASRFGVDTSTNSDQVKTDTYVPVRASGALAPRIEDIEPALIPDMSAPAPEDGANAGCEIGLEATPQVAAMVNLTMDAPCHPNALITVQHQGMKFHAVTDGSGVMRVDVPALSKEAYFLVSLESGESAAAITGVSDLGSYDRAVLQWTGALGLELHAFEFDANREDDGHVWAASHRSPQDSATGDRGFMTRLGVDQSAASKIVDVYTYPSGSGIVDGAIELTVEAEVTAKNCGRSVAAQSIQLRPENPPAAKNLSMRFPSCERVGEFLVLKNTFEDLTLAAK